MYSLLGEEEELLVACCSVTNCDITFVERHYFERERERERWVNIKRERETYMSASIYVCSKSNFFFYIPQLKIR